MPGFNSFYGVDALTNLGSDLASSGGNSVMTSLDEQTESGLAEAIFAYSVETDPTVSNGFTLEPAQATDTTLATTVSAMGSQALGLAQGGYIVTAVGTADANQVLLVGTKVHGDTLPRNFFYRSSPGGSGGTFSAGEIIVGHVFGNDAGNNPNLPADETVLSQ